MKVRIKKLSPLARAPEYATDGSGAFDIYAVEANIPRGETTILFKTGLAFAIPEGHVMLVFSRSGHGFKHALRLANCVGVIDSDYRGELQVKLTYDDHSFDTDEFKGPTVMDLLGKAVAQGIIIPYPKIEFEVAEELGDTARGQGGFGSTDRCTVEVDNAVFVGAIAGAQKMNSIIMWPNGTWFFAKERDLPAFKEASYQSSQVRVIEEDSTEWHRLKKMAVKEALGA